MDRHGAGGSGTVPCSAVQLRTAQMPGTVGAAAAGTRIEWFEGRMSRWLTGQLALQGRLMCSQGKARQGKAGEEDRG